MTIKTIIHDALCLAGLLACVVFVASLFVVCFTLVFGAFLVHIAVKHGRVVERKEALEMKRRKWWEELR